MQSNFIEVCGHKLEYQLIPAHQFNRPTLVFLHGYTQNVGNWLLFSSRLARAGTGPIYAVNCSRPLGHPFYAVE